jgi:hypothetical protein
MSPVWRAAAFALGAGTALLGDKAAHACTEAVENVIEQHYAGQIAELKARDPALAAELSQFRDDELAHRDHRHRGRRPRGARLSLLTAVIQRRLPRRHQDQREDLTGRSLNRREIRPFQTSRLATCLAGLPMSPKSRREGSFALPFSFRTVGPRLRGVASGLDCPSPTPLKPPNPAKTSPDHGPDAGHRRPDAGREAALTFEHVDLKLKIIPEKKAIEGDATLTLAAKSALTRIVLDFDKNFTVSADRRRQDPARLGLDQSRRPPDHHPAEEDRRASR